MEKGGGAVRRARARAEKRTRRRFEAACLENEKNKSALSDHIPKSADFYDFKRRSKMNFASRRAHFFCSGRHFPYSVHGTAGFILVNI